MLQLPTLIKPAILLLLLTSFRSSATEIITFGRTRVELLDSAAAAGVAGKPDAYTKALTPFDLRIRLQETADPKEADYLRLASREVRNWPAAEAEQLRQAFSEMANSLNAAGIRLHLPETIQLIKTTGRGEFGAEGYTRENHILLNTAAAPISTHLIAHELFHVFSRYNPVMRDSLYRHFGFKRCNSLAYAAAVKGKVITNPDCPEVSHYITAATPDGTKDLALILYSKQDVTAGKGLEELMALGLLVLEGPDAKKGPAVVDGSPLIYTLQEVPDIFKQIGTNTPYLLHPEEICAEHFAFLVTGKQVREPAYVAAMKETLKQ